MGVALFHSFLCLYAIFGGISRGRRVENGKQIIGIQWFGRVGIGRWHDKRHVVWNKCVEIMFQGRANL